MQLKNFIRQLKSSGQSWNTPVHIKGVITDVDATISDKSTHNEIRAELAEAFAWILQNNGKIHFVTASPFSGSEPAIDQRIISKIVNKIYDPSAINRIEVFCRSGGLKVIYKEQQPVILNTEKFFTITEKTFISLIFSLELIDEICSTFFISPYDLVDKKIIHKWKKFVSIFLEREIDTMEADKVFNEINTVFPIAENRAGCLRFNDECIQVEDTMILFTFLEDKGIDASTVLYRVKEKISMLIKQPLNFSYGPHYIAISLTNKSEITRQITAEYEAINEAGLILVMGDGPIDDREMLLVSGGSSLLTLPLFVGPDEKVDIEDPFIIPFDTNLRYVDAIVQFVKMLVNAAIEEKSYWDLPFIMGCISPKMLSEKLNIEKEYFSTFLDSCNIDDKLSFQLISK